MAVFRLLVVSLLLAAQWGGARAAAFDNDATQNADVMPPAPLHEEELHVSVDNGGQADLVVTLFMPEGEGPFPLAVLNHGANGSKETPAEMPRYRYSYLAYYFLSRGYAVAMPMMRGYAGSGGRVLNTDCDLAAMAKANGQDIIDVVQTLSTHARIDGSRVVLAGQSFGGWNTLGAGSLQSENVRGLVDFAGGVRSSGCKDGAGAAMIDGARRLAEATRVPSIWFYGENDSLFPPSVWQPMARAYARAGGQAEVVNAGRFMDDSHQLLSHLESIPLWAPRLDAFLARIGMASRMVQPDYMPTPAPPATHFAAIGDVGAVPGLNATGQAQYRHFLTERWPRVFLIGSGGEVATSSGGFDPLAKGLGLCRHAHITCKAYAYDDDVVWTGGARAPRVLAGGVGGLESSSSVATGFGKAGFAGSRAGTFAKIDDAEAIPWVNERGRATYRQWLTESFPRAFVVATGGESVAAHGGEDPLGRAMGICRNAQLECRAYAVDGRVVWSPPPRPPAPPRASGFARLDDVGAVPWVNARGRAAYAHFLTVPLPRAFLVAPGGQSVATQGGYDPLARGFLLCQRNGLVCRAYAVGESVVWVRP